MTSDFSILFPSIERIVTLTFNSRSLRWQDVQGWFRHICVSKTLFDHIVCNVATIWCLASLCNLCATTSDIWFPAGNTSCTSGCADFWYHENAAYRPSNLLFKPHQIPILTCFSHRIAVVYAQSIKARCLVENEDVVRATPTCDAPTTSDQQFYCPLRRVLYWRYFAGGLKQIH